MLVILVAERCHCGQQTSVAAYSLQFLCLAFLYDESLMVDAKQVRDVELLRHVDILAAMILSVQLEAVWHAEVLAVVNMGD